jgi:capsular polysaccharide biosynthesis protein
MPHIESRVTAILEAAGFTTVHLERLPWTEQVRLLSSAEYVVGLHGAGLSNLLFSQAKAVLEFHHPMEARPYFALIARELGIRYHFLMGSLEGNSPHFDNITINLEMLHDALEEMLDDPLRAALAEGFSTTHHDQPA